jgi:putative transposase
MIVISIGEEPGMETHVFRVVSMHCDDCAALIDETVSALPGVGTARATLSSREVAVSLDPLRTGPDAVAGALTGLGFRLRPSAAERPPAAPVGDQLSDAAWELLEPLLAGRLPRRGRTREPRQLVAGIAYKYRADVRWREVPAEFGPWQTLYSWWARWRDDGTWELLAAAARERTDLVGELGWLFRTTPD